MSNQKGVLSVFFSLGDKVTKGDPLKKLDFDYFMLWIIFLAFVFIFSGNIYNFFTSGYQFHYLGWSLFGIALMWFQYFSLKNMYQVRKVQKESFNKDGKSEPKEDFDDIDEMLKGFKK